MKLLSLALVLVSIPGIAQIKSFSIALSPNYSLINSSNQTALSSAGVIPTATGYSYNETYNSVKEKYEGKIGATLRGSMDIGIVRRFFITAGVSLSYLRFKRNATVETASFTAVPSGLSLHTLQGSMNSYSMSSSSGRQGESTALYLEIPALAGFTFFSEKLSIRAGVIGAYLIRVTEYRTKSAIPDYSYQPMPLEEWIRLVSNYTMEEYKETNPENFVTLQGGATAEVSYQLAKKISVNVAAKRYFNAIYKKNNSIESDARYTLFSVGMGYTFRR